jgi:outer membrane protein OmpA-like peptidoglycan-associated protein
MGVGLCACTLSVTSCAGPRLSLSRLFASPVEPLPARQSGEVKKIANAPVVRFSAESWLVSSEQESALEEWLARAPKSGQIVATGSSAETAPDEYRRVLAERRAVEVRRILVTAGIPPERVVTATFEPGESPTASEVELGVIR